VESPCFFIDIDGVLYDGEVLIPGGPAAIDFLRCNANPFLLVTNTTRSSVNLVESRLRRLGYAIPRELIYTAPMATLEYLQTKWGRARLFMIADTSIDAQFEAAGHYLTRREEPVDAVVIGTSRWPSFGDVDVAWRLIESGAEPIAMNRDLFFPDGGLQRVGAGAVVAALEAVAQRPMTVIGKPNPKLFDLALAHAGFAREATIMIGDTPEVDVTGARAAGLRSLLVRSGNHSAGEDTGGADWVIDSIDELPTWYTREIAAAKVP